MRKGFSVTLAMVAFAMLVSVANASAPTISAIPDIIVGDAENASGNNVFVFPDAIDLNSKVTDDTTTPGGIIWTYSETGTNVRYLINRVAPVSPSNITAIVSGTGYNMCSNTDPVDANGARTATIRDNIRSPFGTNGGLGPYTGGDFTNSGPWPGQILTDSRTLTLYASDGSTVSTKSDGSPIGRPFIVYTRDNGYDGYSGVTIVYNPNLTGGMPSGWSYALGMGTVTHSETTAGLCLGVTAASNPANDATYVGPYGTVQLVANSCWEARMTVTTTNATVGRTPLWLYEYDNYGSATVGKNEYNGEYYYLDAEGGANSPLTTAGRSQFCAYMMPTQLLTPQFSDSTYGFFNTGLTNDNDFRMLFRIFDIGTSYGANLDSGSVCWTSLEIDRFDMSDMVVDSTVMDFTSFSNAQVKPLAANGSSWAFDYIVVAPSVAGYGGTTGLTVNPGTGADWSGTGDFLMFHPGDYTVNLGSTDNSMDDNYPIDWVSNSTYYIEFQLSAINATAEQYPVDMLRIGADTITGELANVHGCTTHVPDLSPAGGGYNTRGLTMPRAGAAQKYVAFFYTNARSTTSMYHGMRWRPRFEIICSPSIANLRSGAGSNPNGLIINGVKVQKVHFAGQQ